MTRNELSSYLESNQNIEWFDSPEEQQMHFRNMLLDWYRKDESRSTAVKYWKLDNITPEELEREINRGLMVEGITRITGYFTKVPGWNPGKRAELRDRRKFSLSA